MQPKIKIQGSTLQGVRAVALRGESPADETGRPESDYTRSLELEVVMDAARTARQDGFSYTTGADGRTQQVKAEVQFTDNEGKRTIEFSSNDARFERWHKSHRFNPEGAMPTTERWLLRLLHVKYTAGGKSAEFTSASKSDEK